MQADTPVFIKSHLRDSWIYNRVVSKHWTRSERLPVMMQTSLYKHIHILMFTFHRIMPFNFLVLTRYIVFIYVCHSIVLTEPICVCLLVSYPAVFLALPITIKAVHRLSTRAVWELEEAGKQSSVLQGVREYGILEVDSMREDAVVFIHPVRDMYMFVCKHLWRFWLYDLNLFKIN